MKKSIINVVVLMCAMISFSPSVYAQTDSELLQEKIGKFTLIHADFTQQVINPEGQVIQESMGELTISRPGNFHWQVTQPDEELIVSNGKDMWLFSPFIEQVTIMNFSDAIAGTPFALLSGADATQWENFDVKKSGNQFVVMNNADKTSTNKFTFIFDRNENINEFVVEEQQGQRSVFKLTHKALKGQLSDDYFNFKIPKGIEIDDQR